MKTSAALLLLSMLPGCRRSAQLAPAHEPPPAPAEERWFFWAVDFHPRRDTLVVGGSNDSYLKLLSGADFTEWQSLPYLGTITQTRWHPTQDWVAVSVQDGKSTSAILDVASGARVELDSLPESGARAIGWNRSGELLAVGDNEGYLSVFDARGRLLRRADTEQRGLMSLDWHPERDLLVTVGERITLYDYAADRLTHIEDRAEDVLMLSAAWHPSGDFYVTGDYGDVVRDYPPLLQFWTIDGRPFASGAESGAALRNVCWSPDGERLATASDRLRLYDVAGQLVAEADAEHLLWGLDWNADATKLVATDVQGGILLWDRHLRPVTTLDY